MIIKNQVNKLHILMKTFYMTEQWVNVYPIVNLNDWIKKKLINSA